MRCRSVLRKLRANDKEKYEAIAADERQDFRDERRGVIQAALTSGASYHVSGQLQHAQPLMGDLLFCFHRPSLVAILGNVKHQG